MSIVGKVVVGVVVVAGVGGAFYYVMQRRKAMLAGTLATPAAPTGLNMGYSTAGAILDTAGGLIPSISVVAGTPLPALQSALVAPPPGETTGPTFETRTGRGHF